MWTPEPVNAVIDVQERFRQLEPRGRQPAAVIRLHPDAGRGSHGRCETARHGEGPADACRDVTSNWTSDS